MTMGPISESTACRLSNGVPISLLFLSFLPLSAQAVTFTNDTQIGCADATYDGQDVIVDACVLTVDCAHTFNSLTVVNGGTVTHSAYSGDPAIRLDLTIALNLTVDSISRVDVTAKGHPASTGDGAGQDGQGYGAGGGYGGTGGDGFPFGGTAIGGATYGLVDQPTDLGSGGGSGPFPAIGGSGGGSIHLSVQGILQIDGRLTADGGDGGVNNWRGGGGGSGGSVFLQVDELTGTGDISANGGDAGTAGGGGGGGRISIDYTSSNAFAGNLTACGGAGASRGGAGTILTRAESEAVGDLLVDNCGQGGEFTSVPAPYSLNALTIINGGRIELPSGEVGSLHVGAGGWLMPPGHAIPLDLIVTGDATIDVGGVIFADGYGHPASTGTGRGDDADRYGGGGGYGGHGGPADTWVGADGGSGYGLVSAPVDLGSGGGSATGPLGGSGGGAINLTVGGSLNLDGILTVNGIDGPGYFTGSNIPYAAGGGSGGSVLVTTNTLSGTGLISANGGGTWNPHLAGGGGGGRIALHFVTTNFGGVISACGGEGFVWGGAGTILTRAESEAVGDLLVDNCGQDGEFTSVPAPYSLNALTIINGGRIELPSGEVGSLHVGAGGWLMPPGPAIPLDLTVTGDATIDVGGVIFADGYGHPASTGDGAGQDGQGYGAGGGYGGTGGDGFPFGGTAIGGATYGLVDQPTDLGSGGGSGPFPAIGGSGGGSIHLSVQGSLQADGCLTADGSDGGVNDWRGGGGGSGGSVYVQLEGVLFGAGRLSARGGNAGTSGGGGGGGRIAFEALDLTAFTGAIDVSGGVGYESGKQGTIYEQTSLPPHIIDQSPASLALPGIDRIDLTFDTAIDESTFAGDDVVLVGPDSVAISTTQPVHLGQNVWSVTFPPQIASGAYSLCIGPDIENLAGIPMNQDGDATLGEDPDDKYCATITVVSVEPLTLDVPAPGSFSTAGELNYYSISLGNSMDVEVVLDDLDDLGGTELYAGFDYLPTANHFDYRASAILTADKSIRIPGTRSGTYYILARGSDVPDPPPSDYSILVHAPALAITDVSPTQGWNAEPNAGLSTIRGWGFDPNASLVLQRAGEADIPVSELTWLDHGTMFARLDVNGATSGPWEVVLTNPDTTSTTFAYNVLEGGAPQLDINLALPSALGFHIASTLYIEYKNNSGFPIPAPLITLHGSQDALLTTDEAKAGPGLWTDTPPPWLADTVQAIALGSDPDPQFLKPGDTGRIPVYYRGLKQPWDFSRPPIEFSLGVLYPTDATPIDWDTLKIDMQPETMAADAWEAIWLNLKTQIGNTWGDYVIALADNAAYLHSIGRDVHDIGSLLAFEIAQASALSPHRFLAGSVDACAPAPGMPLVFSRVYGQSIDSRYELGTLGRGWSHNWDIYARELTDGTVLIHGPNNLDRSFASDGVGGYSAPPGEFGVLAKPGGIFCLSEKDGTVWQFLADNRLDYVEDTNGNRITAGYVGSLMTSLTHSCGASLAIAYNGEDRICQVTDHVGRITTFAYTGEYLTDVVAPGTRSTHYAYDTTSPSPKLHALLSVQHPDMTHDFFVYDALGRLTQTQRDAGAETVTYTYDATGTVTVTDATARSTVLNFGESGQLLRAVDGVGNPLNLEYDVNRQLAGLSGPESQQYRYSYDPRGNVVGIMDPLANPTSFTYTPPVQHNRLASVTDARGNKILYGYDAAGNLTSITYEDSTVESFTYDGDGNVLTWTNRRGQTVTYTYNAAGQVLTKDYSTTPATPDNEYTYDTAGNLTSATNEVGTIGMTYDPGTDWLTRIDYPGEQYFTYGYSESGRRTSRTDQDGNVLNYTYDAVGRLDVVSEAVASRRNAVSVGAGTFVVDYDYDETGRLTQKTLGNAVRTNYEYDQAGRLTSQINYDPDGAVLSSFVYVYDPEGQPASMATTSGLQTYGYDALGQLTSASYPSGRVVTYTYDDVGNRLVVTDDGNVTSYSTNNINQYTTVGTETYAYDPDGNTTSKTDGGTTITYSYDADDRLLQVVTPTATWTYAYDAIGNRVVADVDGSQTQYVVDPLTGIVATEIDGDGAQVDNIVGVSLELRIESTGERFYYTFDPTGNTSELTSATGETIASYGYDVFGAPIGGSTPVLQPFQYKGAHGVTVAGNGTHYMRVGSYGRNLGSVFAGGPVGLSANLSRMYSDELGRFITARLDGAFSTLRNSYGTALNNPVVTWIDTGAAAAAEAVGTFSGMFFDSLVLRGGVNKFVTSKEASFLVPWSSTVGNLAAGYGVVTGSAEFLRGIRSGDGLSISHGFGTIGLSGLGPAIAAVEALGLVSVSSTMTPVLAAAGIVWALTELFPSQINALFDIQSHYHMLTNPFSFLVWLTDLVGSFDPNDKVGPKGYGAEGYIQPGEVMSYTVYFENEHNASAAAREVHVIDQLDPDLDWPTFELGEIAFGENRVSVPPGLTHFETSMAVDGWTWNETDGWYTGVTPLIIDIVADLNIGTGLIQWDITSYDPNTGFPPSDPYAGFLPPDDVDNMTRRGEGHFSYTIKPDPGLPTGTQIRNTAGIVFDVNPPIVTPTTLNTIDAGGPTSNIPTLPTCTESFPVTIPLSGQDDAGGSGVATYDVFVSVDGGPLAHWTTTPETTAYLTGQNGHNYGIYSVATDNVGHRENPPSEFDVPMATTWVTDRATVITSQPVGQAVCEGESITLSTAAQGIGGVAYQWRRDAIDLPGATSDTLYIASASASDSGNYDVVVTDLCGSVTSDPTTVTVLSPAAIPTSEINGVAKNRFMSFVGSNPGMQTAIRVTFVDLPAPFDVLNGTRMWVGPPSDVSESGGSVTPVGGFPSFFAAQLQCGPYYTDWSSFGTVYVYGEAIVPDGQYSMQSIQDVCSPEVEMSFSGSFDIQMSRWGDVSGPYDGGAGRWTGPDGVVGIPTDTVSILDKFSGQTGAPIKARADIEPATPNLIINVSDLTRSLDAFQGFVYPFDLTVVPCP